MDIPKNVWHGLECLEPAVLLECKEGPFVEHEVDGMKEYCRVAINDEGKLTIAIEKGGVRDVDNIEGGHQQEHKHEDKHHHYLRREFSYSNNEQNLVLPDDVVKDQISAKVGDGILTVTMPKTAPKTEPKQKVTKAIEVS